MSNGTINKVIIIGFAGADPIIKDTDTFKIAKLNIATNEKVKGVKETMWHSCVFFGKLAEIVTDYVKKGDKVYVEGKLTSRKWTDKSGQEKVVFEVLASEIQILTGKEKTNVQSQSNDDFNDDIPF